MKNNKGFTLIELIVGIAIMAIVFGGIVYIFGASSTSAQMGMNQQQAYEDARTTMDALKTSLRYATNIAPTQPSAGDSSLSYTTTQYDKHWSTGTDASNKTYNITVEFKSGVNPDKTDWSDTTKKQLTVKIVNSADANEVREIYYPKYAENSSFTSSSDFPVIYTSDDTKTYGTDVGVYKITLPVQYKAGSEYKTDTLVSSVTPSDFSTPPYVTKDTSSGGGNTPTTGQFSTADKAKTLIDAVNNMLNTNKGYDLKTASSKYTKYSSEISAGAFFVAPGTSGITVKVYDYLSRTHASDGTTLLSDIVGDTAWILIPCDKDGNYAKGNSDTAPAGWVLLIAKNVVYDPLTKFGIKTYLDTETWNDLAKNNIYRIRPDYGFLTYRYYCSNTGVPFTGTGQLGYAKAKESRNSNSSYYIGFDKSSWVNDYTKYSKRIDYNSKGEEYTAATAAAAGTTYSPPT